jgi:hypothetical protein
MIEPNMIYSESDEIGELFDNANLYMGRIFSVRVIDLDGVFAPAYHICMLCSSKIEEDRTFFIELFDDTKTSFIGTLNIIEAYKVKSFTMFPESSDDFITRFESKLDKNVMMDFHSRAKQKNGYVSISTKFNQCDLIITQESQVQVFPK